MFLGDFGLLSCVELSHLEAPLWATQRRRNSFARLNLSIHAIWHKMHKLLKRANRLQDTMERIFRIKLACGVGLLGWCFRTFKQTSASFHDDPVSTFGAGREALQPSQKPPDQSFRWRVLTAIGTRLLCYNITPVKECYSGANMSFQKFKANCMDSTRQHHLNTRDWTLALVAHRAWSLDIYTSIMNGEWRAFYSRWTKKSIKPCRRLPSKTPGPKFQCCGPKCAAQRQHWNLGMQGDNNTAGVWFHRPSTVQRFHWERLHVVLLCST